MRFKNLFAAGSTLLLVAGLFTLGSTAASAHTAYITGVAVCDGAAGSASVSWILSNDYPHPMVVTTSDNPAIPVGTTVPAAGEVHGSITLIQNLSAPAAGAVATASLQFTWPNDNFLQPKGANNTTTYSSNAVAKDCVNTLAVTNSVPDCVQSPEISYTFVPATGSGVITVTGGTADALMCNPLYVRAAAWSYDLPASGMPSWPQTLIGFNDTTVDKIGAFAYAPPQAASCRQYDIYSSWNGFAPDLDLPSNLLGSHEPWEPDFLHQTLGPIEGQSPTYSVTTSSGCNDIPIPEVTPSTATCFVGQTLVLPTLSHISWGEPEYTNEGRNYSVVATATDGFVFPGDLSTTTLIGTLSGPLTDSFCVPGVLGDTVIAPPSGDVLAATGSFGESAGLLLAGVFLLIGGASYALVRRRRSTLG